MPTPVSMTRNDFIAQFILSRPGASVEDAISTANLMEHGGITFLDHKDQAQKQKDEPPPVFGMEGYLVLGADYKNRKGHVWTVLHIGPCGQAVVGKKEDNLATVFTFPDTSGVTYGKNALPTLLDLVQRIL